MKRTIIAVALALTAFTGVAHADRTSSVEKRVTEIVLSLKSASERAGETDEKFGSDFVAMHDEFTILLGGYYDTGALMAQQGVAIDKNEIHQAMMEAFAEDKEFAAMLTSEEKENFITSIIHVMNDGHQGK